ncbi:50S ribosomal protein L23 [Gynuella sunshinyii]|uniref:Large ribosomal subunit protein uL23 n=1 Tax=Gynuella sunshinyii YC6258 TaxID=1445510 RepID=A0A0C5VW92_9GAMM|nr:50S ribosomal protein L23 [Gynuella sunshinyii]AJQ97588.1 ribosomal protein L23 [Gynuella sunshinyii YC6258]
MNEERMLKILKGPHISEKATVVADGNGQYVFRVVKDATKPEIKEAVEKLFEVSVVSVRTLNQKGKVKRTARGVGKRSDIKKAYVRLADGQEIDFLGAE